jgi:hypothetical protein
MKNIEVPPNLMLLGCKLIMGWPSVTSIDSQDTRSFSVHSGLRSINQVFPLELELVLILDLVMVDGAGKN